MLVVLVGLQRDEGEQGRRRGGGGSRVDRSLDAVERESEGERTSTRNQQETDRSEDRDSRQTASTFFSFARFQQPLLPEHAQLLQASPKRQQAEQKLISVFSRRETLCVVPTPATPIPPSPRRRRNVMLRQRT